MLCKMNNFEKNAIMANKRILKKEINVMVFDVIDECLYIQEINEDKFEATEAVIEEAISFYNASLEAMNKGKAKADFRNIVASVEEKSIYFTDKLNTLNA